MKKTFSIINIIIAIVSLVCISTVVFASSAVNLSTFDHSHQGSDDLTIAPVIHVAQANNYIMQQRFQQRQMQQQRMLQQQQQQRMLQQQRARQAAEQARAAQQRVIRDQNMRRQMSQRRNMTQKLQKRRIVEQNNRANLQRRQRQQRLVQQKTQKNKKQAQVRQGQNMTGLAVLGSASRTPISPQISQRIRNLTQKPANNSYRTKAIANIKQKAVNSKNKTGNGKNLSRISGNRTGGGGSGRSPFKLTKVYNQSAKPLSKDVALRLGSVTKGGSNWAKLSGQLRDAAKGKGNFGIGSGTREQAEVMGKGWVGRGYKVASDGKTLISADGLRQYRPPNYKPRLGKTQANFEQRFPDQKSNRWQSNAHMNITD